MTRSAQIRIAVAAATLAGMVVLTGGPVAATPSSPEQIVSRFHGDVGSPALSYTGRYVAYIELRRDVVSPKQQLRRLDLKSGQDELLNRSITGGNAGGNNSMPPVISGDGSRVAFTSNSSRLVAGDTNSRFDAFVRDATTDTTVMASVAFDGGPANRDTGMTSMSMNGRYVVFTSSATDVVPASTTTNSDVYRRDLVTNTTGQVTVRPDGSPSKGPGSVSTDVSGNGNLVAFTSYSNDLAANDGDQEADLFVRNMTTGKTRWLGANIPAGANPGGVVMSPDGQWISTRWDDGSVNLTRVDTGATSMAVANGYALKGSFSSALGRFVFISGGRPYVRDLASGINSPIATPDGGTVFTVSISGNGQYVAYDWTPDDGGPSLIFRVAL